MEYLHNKFFQDDEYLEEFTDFLKTVIWSERSPFNTEMFFMWSMIRAIKPELFIESGTFRGYSANFICEALMRNGNEAEFVTFGLNLENCLPFARKRLEPYPFARLVEGDSRIRLESWPKETRRVAFFVDGPKGHNMIPLFFTILSKFSNIQFIAIHDSQVERGGNRSYLLKFFGWEYPITFCDSLFQEKFPELDEPLIGRSKRIDWRPYHWNGVKQQSYAVDTGYVLPVLGKVGIPLSRWLFYSYRQIRFQTEMQLRPFYRKIRHH